MTGPEEWMVIYRDILQEMNEGRPWAFDTANRAAIALREAAGDHDYWFEHRRKVDAAVAGLVARAEAAEQRAERLEKATRDYLAGDYDHPGTHRPMPCQHGVEYYHDCRQCDEAHFLAALATPSGKVGDYSEVVIGPANPSGKVEDTPVEPSDS